MKAKTMNDSFDIFTLASCEDQTPCDQVSWVKSAMTGAKSELMHAYGSLQPSVWNTHPRGLFHGYPTDHPASQTVRPLYEQSIKNTPSITVQAPSPVGTRISIKNFLLRNSDKFKSTSSLTSICKNKQAPYDECFTETGMVNELRFIELATFQGEWADNVSGSAITEVWGNTLGQR